MSKETKIGLLVGVLFIVVFGLVLSQSSGPVELGGSTGASGNLNGPLGGEGVLGLKSVPLPTTPTPGTSSLVAIPDGGGDPLVRTVGLTGVRKAPNQTKYRVQARDTIEKIMRTVYGADFTGREMCEQVLRANGVTERQLQIGRELTMPVLETRPANRDIALGGQPLGPSSSGRGMPSETPGGMRTHTIARGETLASIARREYGNAGAVSKIVAANPGVNPNRLQIGQVLKLPPREVPH